MGRFVHVAAFNAGGYFRTDSQVLVCGDFLVSLSSSMPNLFWTWGWSGYRGIFEYWGVFWDVLIISILTYVFKWFPVGTCVMSGRVNWLVKLIYDLVLAWCDFYRKVVPRLWYIISAGVESIWCMPGSLPHFALGVWRISGAFSDVLSHYGTGVFFFILV